MALEKDHIIKILFENRIRLTAFSRSIVCSFHDAEDVYQNISLKAVRSATPFKDSQHLINWLWVVCRSESFKKLKEKKNNLVTFDEDVSKAIENEFQNQGAFDSSDVYFALETCLAKLSSFAKKLIALRYQQNLTGVNLAKVLNRKVGSVYVALSRTHQTLRRCMQQKVNSSRN